MKFVSWNVNGIRACINKGFFEFACGIDADFLCLQEIKVQEWQINLKFRNYKLFINSAEKPGYSGTLIYSKYEPISVVYGIDGKYNDEGRVIALEFENFYLVNAYVPNAQEGLKRIDYRVQFENDMREYLIRLNNKKPVVYCGDLNVAHYPIDLKNPKANEGNAGYSIQEREKFGELLESGFVDTFRYLYPDKVKYSWWSYRFNARANNAGWRIDYFVVSEDLKNKIENSDILTEITGSDHAPVILEINI